MRLMIARIISHIKVWNKWRKHSLNGKLHKLFVLFGIIKSPTFEIYERAVDQKMDSVVRNVMLEALNGEKIEKD